MTYQNKFPLKRANIGRWLYTWLLPLLVATGLNAQNTYQISGRILDADTQEPLVGATVLLSPGGYGSISDLEGNYTFSARVEPGDYQVVASYTGFSPIEQTVSLNDNREVILEFILSTDALNLNEVVVTGASVATSRRQLGNAIATLDASAFEQTGAIAADQALSGKIAGALVQQNSGDPAGGISVRLRGASTLLGNSDPLYIIDGVLVNNNSPSLVDLGGTSQNRLVDINPADIERIEVIKGAAAAAIYGSRASNGVVQIFTKRGRQGEARVNFSTSARINSLRKEIDYNTAPLAWEAPLDNDNLNTVPAERFNFQDEFFETGFGTDNNISFAGGTDRTRYFISASYLNNDGIIKNTNFERFGGRLNLDQQLTNWLNLGFGLNYTRSSSQDIPNGGINAAYGAITGFVFSDNQVNPQPSADGIYPVTSLLVPRSNPLEAVDRFDFGQRTNRTITNVSLTAVPDDHWTIRYVLGLDYSNQSATGFIPIGNTSPEPDGFARRSDLNTVQYNSDLTISYATDLSSSITSTTVLGGTWQYEGFDRSAIQTSRLAPFVSISGLGELVEPGESRSEAAYWGAFVQQTFGISNKLFVTGAVRLDGASVFGEDERDQIYGKASASYLLSEEDFWKNGSLSNVIDVFKLRASWGQAGNLTALGPFDRLNNYGIFNYLGGAAAFPSATQGNPNLAPERQEEIELGLDLALFKNRIGIEVTYYEQEVTDLLINREVAASTGFTNRFENVGTLENSGIELLLRATPIRNNQLQWNITATYASNENMVTSVAGGGQLALAGSFATNYVIEGQPLGVFFRQFYARDGQGNILLDDNGFPMGGTNEDGTNAKVIGDPNPDWFGSLINEFNYKNFTLRVQFDAVQGFDVFNWNRRLLDNVIFGGGPNVGEELLGNQVKGFGRAQANIFEEFVEDGSFVKLRELSLSYDWRPNINFIEQARISVVGRNLISWDNYSGWDPEINTAGQSNGVRGFDFAGVPIPRTYEIGLNLTF
ncbi:MAG: SusC/RagA family TonB-linked outer membrane protein [Bacteroidota bacterium]